MAKFRHVYTSFWNDPDVLETYTPEDKLFYLYLLTNDNTSQIGVYQITKKQMAFELGYSLETINALMERFEHHHKAIEYNPETREIVLKKWGRYNLSKGGKPVEDAVKKDVAQVKHRPFLKFPFEATSSERMKHIILAAYPDVSETPEPLPVKGLDDTPTNRDTNRTTNRDTSRTTIRGEKQKQKQKEKQKEKQQPQEEKETQNDIGVVVDTFEKLGFGLLNPNKLEQLEYWMDQLNTDVVVKALVIADNQNKQNMNYVNGILKNWKNRGLDTIEKIEAAQAQHESQQNTPISYQQKARERQGERQPEWMQKEKEQKQAAPQTDQKPKTAAEDPEIQKMIAEFRNQ